MESKTITNHLSILTILPEISSKTLSFIAAIGNCTVYTYDIENFCGGLPNSFGIDKIGWD